jgi:hypothetical protein
MILFGGQQMITGLQPILMQDGKDIGLDLPYIVVDDDFLEYLDEECIQDYMEVDEFAIYFNEWMRENC